MIVQQIVEKASQAAQSAQAHLRTQETSRVSFENDLLKSASSSQRTEIQLKVIVDGKAGTSSTTDPADVDGVIRRALEAARFGSPANFEMPGPQDLPPVKTYDPSLLPLEKADMIRLGQGMMDMVKSYHGEILAAADVIKTVQKVEFANSNGAEYAQEHTNFNTGVGGVYIRGTDILYAGKDVSQKNRAVDPEEIATKAIEFFRMAERTAPVESGQMPVIFTPNGLSALMLSLALGLDGKNVYLGASPLRDKLGELIADPRFSLVDDPLLDFAAQSASFDDEGMPRQSLPLIEAGVLRNFVYDLDTAGRMGARPTGHGPNRSYTNLVIQPGQEAYKDMLKNVRSGLLVDSFLGLGQGNPINGEFSVNVYLGYKIENGEITGRVKDVMLAGNAYDALKDIAAISQERDWVTGFFNGLFPSIQVSKLSVVAK